MNSLVGKAISATRSAAHSLLTIQQPIRYAPGEHFFMRLILAFATVYTLKYKCTTDMPFPNGIAHYFDISFICEPSYYGILHFLFFLACGTFVLTGGYSPNPALAERSPVSPFRRSIYGISVIFLAVFHLIRNTALNSDGSIGHTNQMISFIFISYAISHISFLIRRKLYGEPAVGFADKDKEKYGDRNDASEPTEDDFAVYMSIQGMAACYMVSAITKHVVSEGKWIDNSFNLVAKMIKTNEENHKTYPGRPEFTENILASYLAEMMVFYPIIAKFVFGSGFWLELLAPLALLNRYTLFLGGLGLYSMHEGIRLLMQLNFITFKTCLIALFINIPYWVALLFALLVRYNIVSGHYLNSFAFSKRVSSWFWTAAQDANPQGVQRKVVGPREGRQKRGLWWFFTRLPCILVVVVVLCLVLKEWYPFSHFPMYSSIKKPTISFFFVSDVNDNVIPLRKYLGMKSPQLKKTFWSYIRQFKLAAAAESPGSIVHATPEMIRKAGDKTLRQFSTGFVEPRLAAEGYERPFRLVRMFVTVQNGTIVRTPEVIGQLE